MAQLSVAAGDIGEDCVVRVLGVDGCRKGWVGIVLARDGVAGCIFATTIDSLVDAAGPVDGIAIDIPIGLPDDGRRRPADEQARTLIGRRASSVFFAPARTALLLDTFAAANAESVRLTGIGISQQVYALRTKILEVEAWLPSSRAPAWEVHPEVSFAIANSGPLGYSKATWAGIEERRRLLRAQGLVLEGNLAPGGVQAGVDDVLDAAIAAWSAARLVRGEGISVPDPPGSGPAGRPIAIWA